MSCYCLLNNIRINSSSAGPAWARLEEYLLNPPKEDRDLDDDLLERLRKAGSLKPALVEMGWDVDVSTEGHLFRFSQTLDNAFDPLQQTLWSLLTPFLYSPPTPFFIFSGADGNVYRWRFEGGLIHEDHVERYIWNCDDVVTFPRREVVALLNRLGDGIVSLKEKVGGP